MTHPSTPQGTQVDAEKRIDQAFTMGFRQGAKQYADGVLPELTALKNAKEAAEAELAKLRTLITEAVRDRNIDGKTIVDFQAVWLDQARRANGKLEADLAASENRVWEK